MKPPKYPYWNTLTAEEKRLAQGTSPIARALRMKAATGKVGQTAKEITGLVKDVENVGAELTGIPGSIRFSKDPVGNLKGAGKTIEQTILGSSPYVPQQINTQYNPEDTEKFFNTLDIAGVASSALPLAKPAFNIGKNLIKKIPSKFSIRSPRTTVVNKFQPMEIPETSIQQPIREVFEQPVVTNQAIQNSRPYISSKLEHDLVNRINGMEPVHYPELTREQAYAKWLNQNQSGVRDSWGNYNQNSLKNFIINKSGLTKEELLSKLSQKEKDILSKLSEQDFKQTVLKPTNEVVPYYEGSLENYFSGNQSITPLNLEEYTNRFNSKLDLLNEIIAKRNKSNLSGATVKYKVKGLTSNGRLIFETPRQEFPRILTENQKQNLEWFERNPEDFAINKAGLKQNKDGDWIFEEVGESFKTKEDALNHLKEQVDENLRKNILIEGESDWSVGIKPGEWRGNVEDIPSKEYYRNIPGLEMTNTGSSVFGDRIARRGTGTYEAINEYLKQMNLGRLKPGFNSQTEFSRGAWENFVKSGRAYGFYGNPRTVYGVLRTTLPIGVGAGIALQNKQKGGIITDQQRHYVDSVLNANRGLNWVQRLYDKNPQSIQIQGQHGRSTHFMESGDGRAYPTVVQLPNGGLKYLGNDAYKYADSTKSFIQFPSDAQAQWFSKNYKRGTNVLKGFQSGGKTGEDKPWYSYLNPFNWGSDEPDNFGEAFREAKENGLSKFTWNGKEYSTILKEENKIAPKETPKLSVKETPKLSVDETVFPEDILLWQAHKESGGFQPKVVSGEKLSPARAEGLTQIRPIALKEYYRLSKDPEGSIDLKNPEHAVKVQRFLMNDHYNSRAALEGNPSRIVRQAKALAFYNNGRSATIKALRKAAEAGVDIYQGLDWLDYVPYETKDYINKILLHRIPKYTAQFHKDTVNNPYNKLYAFRQGGNLTRPRVIEDQMGQWRHPGKITRIKGNTITMEGVNYPLLGVSDKNQRIVMEPGKNYKFTGAKHVTEYPL